MSDELTLKIVEGNPDILLSQKKSGIISKKVVTIDSLTATLADSYQFSTGIMPRGTRFFSGTSTNYSIGIETAPMTKLSVISVNSETKEKVMLPLPHCLFVIHVRGSKINSTYVYALKRSVFGPDDNLFNFPYGNASDDGRICWGDVKLPEIKTPLALSLVVSMFLESEYNGDLFNSSTINAALLGVKPLFYDAISVLKGKDKFPLEVLRMGSSRKISDVIRNR